MDLSSLASLGKVAGLGGIAIWAVVLLVGPIINKTSGVPAAQRGPLLRFIAMGAFGIAALGIVAWLVSGLFVEPVVTAGSGGMAAGRDVSGNTVTISQPLNGGGQSPAEPAAGSGVTAAPGGMAAGRDVTGNTVTIGQPQAGDVSSPAAASPGTRSP